MPGPDRGPLLYAWRGAFTDPELSSLHAEGFGHQLEQTGWNHQLDSNSLGWVTARDDRGLVGFVAIAWDGRAHAFVEDTLVAVRSRRQGVGVHLIEVARDHAARAGCEWLHVDFEEHLKSFYLDACGFVPTDAGLMRLSGGAAQVGSTSSTPLSPSGPGPRTGHPSPGHERLWDEPTGQDGQMEQLRSLIARRTVRSFLDEDVPVSVVRQLVDQARWTGSARNRQPWRFVAVYDQATRAGLAGLGAYAAHLATAPVVVVLLSPRERHLDTEFDAGRIAQSLTLAAASAGLGSCVTSLYPEENADTAATVVGAEPGWSARHAVALGRPDSSSPVGRLAIPTGRRSTDELLSIR
ncbi:GNAT family N-acetyltransferase [Sanguibacter sp. 4.1]|uniref:GNAT family N-acetyltransferase n=1 Tax=Sanguibacter biliveldensis TaxID=3030830 RepID=A0AAF1C3E3_9MICO|nr:GNAT family N-acetyltransferase [Sanguibacter sp. 4.1]WPF80763.1 GNAT family N-acetyltransferase [Sanguibacter sp. 4.1]